MSDVTIALKSEGVEGVKSALQGVRAATAEAEAAATAAVEAGVSKRTAARRREVDQAKSFGEQLRATQKSAQTEHESLVARVRRDDRFSSAIGGGGHGSREALVGSSSGPGSLDKILSSLTGGGGGLAGLAGAAGLAAAGFGVLHAGIDLAANALKSLAGFILSDVVKPGWELETHATQFANDSGLKAGDVEARARAIGIRNNMKPEDVLGAAKAFGNTTGQRGLGLEVAGTVATISKGRGIDMGSLTDMASGVYRDGMSAGDIKKAMLTLVGQASQKNSTVGVGALAELGPRAMAAADHLAGDRQTQVAELGAMIQGGRRGFGTARATATGLDEFVEQTVKGAGSHPERTIVNAAGQTQVADVGRLLGQLLKESHGGGETALKGLGYEGGAAKLIGAYGKPYGEAFTAAKAGGATDAAAGEAGAKAVEDFVHGLMTATATMAGEEAKRDAVQQTTGQKWDAAVETIKEKLLEAMPAINQFVGELVKDAPAIGAAALQAAQALVFFASVLKSVMDTLHTLFNVEVPTDKSNKFEFNPTTGKIDVVERKGSASDEALDRSLGRFGLTDEQRTKLGGRAGKPPAGVGPLIEDSERPTPLHIPPLAAPQVAPPRPAEAPAGASATAAAAATAPSAEEFHTALKQATGTVASLDKVIQDVTASFGSLARHKPFTERGH